MLLILPAFLSACSGSAGPAANSDPPPPPPITVSVSASSARVATGATEQFNVTVQNAANPAVNWEVNSILGGNSTVGTIGATGLYTAPANPGLVTVGAVLVSDATKSGSVAVTVVAVGANSGVFPWHGDNMLSGANTQETTLTTATVGSGHFGKLFSCPVDGVLYAQPLYFANLSIPQQGLHNVVFAATEHDTVYAFDADTSPCQKLWQISFLVGGATTVPSGDVSSTDITPEIGITGTPVIDPASKTLYVVVKTKESGAYVQRLHALDLVAGGEKFSGPALIQAIVPGIGDGNSGSGQVPFSALRENQQAALALADGRVYVAFGGHGNTDPFHGWIFAYNAAALNQSPAVLNLTPNGSRGGIWQSGAPPSVDGSGNVFVATGNGTFDVNAPRSDYAQSVAKLNGATLARADSLTASNYLMLDSSPTFDLGAGGVLLLPDAAGSALHPHLAIVIGQQGTLYLLDRDNLGGYKNGAGGGDQVVQTLNLAAGTSATPADWAGNGTVNLYVAGAGGHLQAFQVANAVLSSGANSTTTFGSMGATPSVSANGSTAGTGVVWALDTSGFASSLPAVLHAYDAGNLGTSLYDSSQKSGDAAGAAVKFAVPIIANGKVYVGTSTELSVYAVLP